MDEYVSDASVLASIGGNVTVYSLSPHQTFSFSLNQVNIQANSNKFYIAQILTDSKRYFLYTRYGRVGEKGVVKCSPLPNSFTAVKLFQKVFRSKTGYLWRGRAGTLNEKERIQYPPKPKKYSVMETEAPQITVSEAAKEEDSLPPTVRDFIISISSEKMLSNTVRNFNIDIKRLPLGKISVSQISSGRKILIRIEKWLKARKESLLSAGIDQPEEYIQSRILELSSEFWTLIPYASSRSSAPPILNNIEGIMKAQDLIDELSNIRFAGEIIHRSKNIAQIYDRMNIRLESIWGTGIDSNRCKEEIDTLQTYIKSTCAAGHHYQLDLLSIHRVLREDERYRDRKNYFLNMPNHMLLFHGSRMSNYLSILTEGIRIPRENQVLNGSVLGLGAYFADSVSKSYNYCRALETNNIGYVLVCEVALGDRPQTVTQATCDRRPPSDYTSRIAQGFHTPNPKEETTVSMSGSHVRVPLGNLIRSNVQSSSFQYNEYVIYDSRQYRFRYVLSLRCR